MIERDNSGALFKRDKQSDNQPDYTGSCIVNGKKLDIAAWIKESKAGNKYMSLKFSEPRNREAPRPSGDAPLNDGIPW